MVQPLHHNAKFHAALEIARRAAKSCANVLILGESGTGKEVFAKYIHAESGHANGPFIPVNCASIPESLLESEFFGHARGSFTGAQEARIGLFEAAQDGTVFLDEVGDLSPLLQAKLLRVLQERQIKRIGENLPRSVNCRVIAATHKNLALEVREHRFREDLYYRLDVIPIEVPSLRDRPEDLLPLTEIFLKRFAAENGSPERRLSPGAIQYLQCNRWRGNVRELENLIERAVVLGLGVEIQQDDFLPQMEDLRANDLTPVETQKNFCIRYDGRLPTLDEVTHQYLEFAVIESGGVLDKAAREIGIDRKTLYRRLKSSPPPIFSADLQLPQ